MNKKNIIKYSFIGIIILFLLSFFLVPINLKKIENSTIIYDSNGIEIGEIIANQKIRHRFSKIEEIPDFSKKAIVLMEDKSFYSNIGIDFSSLFRAIINNLKSSSQIEGASTISSQVIRNSFWLNEKRTYLKKIAEFYLAISLNTRLSKDEILEYYLNNIYFGYLNYGINSASKYYFDKDLKNLTKAEQLALLIIPKNPNKYNPYQNEINFKNRFDKISNYLFENGLYDENELNSIKTEILNFNYDHKNKLPYISDFIKIKIENNPDKINTSIDFNLTRKIEEISKNTIIPLAWKDVGDYGVILVDRKTNKLKVMLGGIDYYSENGQVNSTTALRQAGSTIKPFTYLLAFKDLNYKASTKILDLPIQFDTSDGNTYNPKNYSLDYKGEVSLAEALSQSINIPAIKLVDKIGVSRLYDFLKTIGITSLDKDIDYYGLALTLGVGEISLYELTQAYSIFANDGDFCKIDFLDDKVNSLKSFTQKLDQSKIGTQTVFTQDFKNLSSKQNCKNVIEKEYTDEIYEILTNRFFKLNGFPVNSNLDFQNKEVFVKTGTSRNFRDNLSIGFTKNYLIGVWVGNKDGTYMKGVSGATGAGEIFKNIVDELEKDEINPEKIIYDDNSIKYLEINSPLDNSVYKIDKNKDINNQEIKLEFNTNLDYDNYKWFINNNENPRDFFRLEKGIFEIKISLYKDGKNIGEEKNKIIVE